MGSATLATYLYNNFKFNIINYAGLYLLSESPTRFSSDSPDSSKIFNGLHIYDGGNGFQLIDCREDKTILYRHISSDSTNTTAWRRIYPDYNSRKLSSNGYIIFHNGLIIQWGVIYAIPASTITGESSHITVTYPTSFISIYPGDVFFHFEYTNPWESKNRITVLGLHNFSDVTLNSLELYFVGLNIDNTVKSVSAAGNAHYFCIGY